VQKNLLKFPAHVPVSDEQDKILGAVYLPCDQLRAKKSLHAAATNCQLAKKYASSPRAVTNRAVEVQLGGLRVAVAAEAKHLACTAATKD